MAISLKLVPAKIGKKANSEEPQECVKMKGQAYQRTSITTKLPSMQTVYHAHASMELTLHNIECEEELPPLIKLQQPKNTLTVKSDY